MPFKGLLLCLTLPYSSMIWADGPHERAQQLPIDLMDCLWASSTASSTLVHPGGVDGARTEDLSQINIPKAVDHWGDSC